VLLASRERERERERALGKGRICTVKRFFAFARMSSALLISSSPLVMPLLRLLSRPSKSAVSSASFSRFAFNLALLGVRTSKSSHFAPSEPKELSDSLLDLLACLCADKVALVGELLSPGDGLRLFVRLDFGVVSSSPITLRGAPCS
jgi:hypothetical protein